jgi:TonB family protein
MKNLFLSLIVLLLTATSAAYAQKSPDSDAAARADLQKTNAEIVRLFQEKKYDEALPLAQKAVRQSEQIFGKNDLETARAWRNLGFVQNFKNDAQAAENSFETALGIYKKIPDLDKPNGAILAEMLEALAFIKYRRRLDSAESEYELALSWREKSDGVDSIKTAKSLSALANISYWQKDYKKSARLFQRLLEVLAKNSAASGDDMALAYYRTECSFKKAGMEDEFEPLRAKYADRIEIRTTAENLPKWSTAKIVKSGVVNGKAINLAKPAYPSEAKQALAQGTVHVQVIIDEQGNVIYACAMKSDHYTLTEAAETAAYRSKFAPTLIDGKPVKITGALIYNFRRG